MTTRPLSAIQAELALAYKAVHAAKTQLEAAEKRVQVWNKAQAAHPEYQALVQQDLRECLGEALFERWVVGIGLKDIRVSAWRVETRHRGLYNDCEALEVTLANGKKFKHESGDWGEQGDDFHGMDDKDYEGLSVLELWEMAQVRNPGKPAAAIMAVADVALSWNGTVGFLDEDAEDVESGYDSDEHLRSASLIPKLLKLLGKVLKPAKKARKE